MPLDKYLEYADKYFLVEITLVANFDDEFKDGDSPNKHVGIAYRAKSAYGEDVSHPGTEVLDTFK